MRMNNRISIAVASVWLSVFALVCMVPTAGAAEQRPIDVIEDNSFFVEEAYNQEPGVVQHIFTAVFSNDARRHGWNFNFTQEWPLHGQDHQISYSIPSSRFREDGDRIYGLGDILINYRYQLLDEGENRPAMAPRFSLILPTGSRDRGTGNGVVGYQWQLSASKKLGSRFAVHGNLGLTYLPGVRARLDGSTGPLSPKRSLVSYNIGASAIYALLPRLHLMLEWVGQFEESIDDAGKSRRDFVPLISPGFRTAVINEEKLQVVVGAAAPIGLNRKANNYGALLYLSIEHKLF
jgi:Putative MetA-pathway of phenol degradation